MKDPRNTKLAKNLLSYSINLQPGENILIEVADDGEALAAELIKQSYSMGAKPFLTVVNRTLQREILLGADDGLISNLARYDSTKMKDMQAYISIRGAHNASEYSDIPNEKMNIYRTKYVKPVHFDIRVPNTKWCLLNYPTAALAQAANMSTEKFEDFYFDVCTLDYGKMSKAMDPLVELMAKTDRVRITGVNTDLSFSIKGLNPVKCDGKQNIPDGEVFSAPVKDSVNGRISFNTPSEYDGKLFNNISLEFKDGKIVKAEANDTEAINRILDTDEGSRYIGEFALGVNPYIVNPMKDVLFDEKIMGSLHFTPGSAYDECFNGNRSAIHWDLVYIQTPEYGGGEIWFDNILIRKDGRFVLKDLETLNPENLK